MLSFFSKKKPDTPPEEIIQGPASGGDEFIFVEKKSDVQPQPNITNLYPPMPGMFYPPALPGNATVSTNATTISFVDGVPFKLAPELSLEDEFDSTQMQVDGILAILTRQMSVEEAEEYTFQLERSICDEC